jgi:hypothetical protein
MSDAAPPQTLPALDAVQERPGPPTGQPPEALPLPPPDAPADGLPPGAFRLRTSSLRVKLALLERGHTAVANARFRRRFLMALALLATLVASGILAGFSGAAMHALLYEPPYRRTATVYDQQGKLHYFVDDQEVDYVQYKLVQQSGSRPSRGEQRAEALSILTGIGVFLLLPLLIWLFLIRRIGRGVPEGPDLEEQIAAVVRAHPAEVEAWGGPAVLRNRDLVRELLAIEDEERRPARPAR